MTTMKIHRVHINITVDVDLNTRIEKMATEPRLNKSQLINDLISMSMDDARLLKATGLLGLAKALRKVREKALNVENKGMALQDRE